MLLARIVTRFHEHTQFASDYFRAQGYMVEIVAPGESVVTPAALELHLDRCTPEQALEAAKDVLARKRSQQPQIAKPEPVAEETREIIAYDITGRPVEFATRRERRKSPNSFGRALVAFLDRSWRGLDESVTRVFRSMAAPFHHAAQRTAAARAGKQELRAAQQREREQQAQREQAERAVRLAEERQRRRAQEEVQAPVVPPQPRQATAAADEAERQRFAAEREAEMERRREQARLAARREAEERERARLEAERREQESRTDEEREQARVAAIHEAMIAAERERARREAEATRVARVAEIAPEEVAAAPQPHASQAPRPASCRRRATDLPPRGWDRRINPIHGRYWRRAFAAAGALVIAVTAGIIAYANRRPAAPLSGADLIQSRAVQQQTPFGAATITPPAATPAPAAPKPSPVVEPLVVRPAPAAIPTKNRAGNSSPAARRLRQSAAQADEVAEDEVVVRHFSKVTPAKSRTTTTAGMKRYSDMQ